MAPLSRFVKFMSGNQRGMSLVEILVALALLGIAGIAFLSGLTTLFQGVMVSQRSVTMEGLAKSQMEYAKSQPYDNINNPPEYLSLDSVPANYTVVVSAERVETTPGGGTSNDTGLQQITVTVTRDEGRTLVLSGYRARQE